MLRIIYVSVACAFSDPEVVVKNIVDKANVRNRAAHVTGALIYTGSYFAQLIEGPDHQVRAIYDSIKEDERHSQLQTILDEGVQDRAFQSWGLAYSGLASYVNNPIEKLIRSSDPASTERVIKLLMEFAKGHRNSL